MEKKKVAVLFGGQSSEHEISCISVATVVKNLDREKYEAVLIGITQEGKWLKTEDVSNIEDGSWKEGKVTAVISPDASEKSVLFLEENQGIMECKAEQIDVIIPVLHGLYGEDGTVQGIFELAKIPYVGCGVLASAVSMDKIYTKLIVEKLNIRQADYVVVLKHELKQKEAVLDKVEKVLEYPVFVKPSNAGSSKGVSKAKNREALWDALVLASEHDRKILIEEAIVGREIECAVLGDYENVEASGVGEILAATDFYDFEAKYHNAESKTVLDPDLPEETVEGIRDAAGRIFRAVDGFGLSRVDFFVEKDTNEIVFNEINTLPGFTSISMYPMLWANKGLDKKELIDKLIDQALHRF